MIGEVFTGPIPKPQSRAAQKGRRKRQAAKVVKSVRQQCVAREGGYCRFYLDLSNYGLTAREAGCEGPLEWAHLGDKKRYKTRGQAPEIRHTTAGSLMLCTKHHQDYDQGRMAIIGDDANLPLRFEVK